MGRTVRTTFAALLSAATIFVWLSPAMSTYPDLSDLMWGYILWAASFGMALVGLVRSLRTV
jgi:hypothetical protein